MTEAPYLASASTLIKALRGAADPPQADWPSKAEIALAAWRDTSFHVPRKEDVLKDWVLDSWSRGQGILNPAYHDILNEVAPESVIPLPILSSFFKAAKKQDISSIIPSARRSFQRPDLNAKSDAWVDVWVSMLGYLSQLSSSDGSEELVHLVSASMQANYNPTNAKKASSSKVSLDVFIATKEREAVRTALEHTLGFLEKMQSETTWEARSSVWAAIESWGGYMERDERWGKLVHTEARTIESLLSKPSAPIGSLLDTLSILERLDHDQTQIGPDVVRWCLALTHTLPTFFDLLVSSLDGLFDESLPESVISSLYDLTIHGPITRYRLRHDITTSLRSLQASKHSSILDLLSTRLRSLITAPERPGKKRKRDDTSDRASAMIGVLTRILSYCMSARPTEDLQDLIATWPEPSSDIARSGRLRAARCIERLSSRVILEGFTWTSGSLELQIETHIDFILELLKTAPADSPLWQIVLAEGVVLLDGPNCTKLEALPTGYIDRKTRLQIISQILVNKQVVAFAPWLLQVADADTLAALSNDSKALKYLAKSDAAELLRRIVNHVVKCDNIAILEGVLAYLKSDIMVAGFCETIMAYPVEMSTNAGSEDIVQYNIHVRFGRWLGMENDSKMGDALLARARAEPELAKIALETIASESDVERVLAACVHIYGTIDVDLSSTLRSAVTDVPEAITLCLSVIDIHAASVTKILKAIAPRSEDSKISYIECLADEKPHALQHDDIAQLWALALPISSLDSILNILSTLTRRRPELILSTLPEVSDVLCAAFASLQIARTKISTNTDLAITAQSQAQSFARLLTAMTSMRTSKAHSHETSPLAKYVPALLVAYVRAAAHPYKDLSPLVRKALEPGLHALCNLATAGGRINARGREGEGLGTPFGLGEGPGGEGEKELWAELWMGWSKARYVGQG
ncbi:hypothetical protein IAT40_002543 [Kwoniella sp. CBS 6097]